MRDTTVRGDTAVHARQVCFRSGRVSWHMAPETCKVQTIAAGFGCVF
jgi:ribosomal protein L37E